MLFVQLTKTMNNQLVVKLKKHSLLLSTLLGNVFPCIFCNCKRFYISWGWHLIWMFKGRHKVGYL